MHLDDSYFMFIGLNPCCERPGIYMGAGPVWIPGPGWTETSAHLAAIPTPEPGTIGLSFIGLVCIYFFTRSFR